MSYNLYKGYIRTVDKQAVGKYKNLDRYLSLEEAEKYDEYAGVLNENTVLIDIDDYEQSERIFDIIFEMQLKTKVVRTTRGYHFLFLNNGRINQCSTHRTAACGCVIDVKVGCKNGLEILKFNGKTRSVDYDLEGYEKEGNVEYDEVPDFLIPLSKNYKTVLFGMKSGDGRNEAMFAHILRCKDAGLSDESIKDMYRNITNPHILGEPLPSSELESIMRDEAFSQYREKEGANEGKGFKHYEFGDELIAENHICKIDGVLHVYKDGVYLKEGSHNTSFIKKAMIDKKKSITQKQKGEVYSYITDSVVDDHPSDREHIAFRNGLLNIETMEFSPLSPDVLVTNMIPHDYNPEAYFEKTDTMLDKLSCGDKNIRALIEECVGYCFYKRNEMSKAFFLTGEKSNGKSTFIQLLTYVLGEENTTSLGLENLGDRFNRGEINGVLANLGDDIADNYMSGEQVAIFKKIVSGNRLTGERKGKDPYQFEPYVKLVFSTNDIPRIKDRSGAVLRRMVIIPFRAVFEEKKTPDYNHKFIDQVRNEESAEYMIKLGIRGLQRVLENNHFTESEIVDKAIEEYNVDNNPVEAFLEETDISEIVERPTNDVFSAYRVYCDENKFTTLSKNSFSRELKRRKNITTKKKREGKNLTWYYVMESDENRENGQNLL